MADCLKLGLYSRLFVFHSLLWSGGMSIKQKSYFWNSLCFSCPMIAICCLSKTIWKFTRFLLLKLALIFEHYFAIIVRWGRSVVVWHSLALPNFGTGMNWLSDFCVAITEFSKLLYFCTLIASSFRIWARIPTASDALYIPLFRQMSGSKWWSHHHDLSWSWKSFLYSYI